MQAMKTRNPYNMTRKRKAALAFLKARGITQVKATYPAARHVDPKAVKARSALIAVARRLTLVS